MDSVEELWSENQTRVLLSYAGGEFAWMTDPAEVSEQTITIEGASTSQIRDALLKDVGDGLLVFLLKELSASEGCVSHEDAVSRLLMAQGEIEAVVASLQETEAPAMQGRMSPS